MTYSGGKTSDGVGLIGEYHAVVAQSRLRKIVYPPAEDYYTLGKGITIPWAGGILYPFIGGLRYPFADKS